MPTLLGPGQPEGVPGTRGYEATIWARVTGLRCHCGSGTCRPHVDWDPRPKQRPRSPGASASGPSLRPRLSAHRKRRCGRAIGPTSCASSALLLASVAPDLDHRFGVVGLAVLRGEAAIAFCLSMQMSSEFSSSSYIVPPFISKTNLETEASGDRFEVLRIPLFLPESTLPTSRTRIRPSSSATREGRRVGRRRRRRRRRRALHTVLGPLSRPPPVIAIASPWGWVRAPIDRLSAGNRPVIPSHLGKSATRRLGRS
jgi:hypothetical protein